MKCVQTEYRGRMYRAEWTHSGDCVEVHSEYGTGWASLKGREPSEVARDLLQRIVEESSLSRAAARRPRFRLW